MDQSPARAPAPELLAASAAGDRARSQAYVTAALDWATEELRRLPSVPSATHGGDSVIEAPKEKAPFFDLAELGSLVGVAGHEGVVSSSNFLPLSRRLSEYFIAAARRLLLSWNDGDGATALSECFVPVLARAIRVSAAVCHFVQNTEASKTEDRQSLPQCCSTLTAAAVTAAVAVLSALDPSQSSSAASVATQDGEQHSLILAAFGVCFGVVDSQIDVKRLSQDLAAELEKVGPESLMAAFPSPAFEEQVEQDQKASTAATREDLTVARSLLASLGTPDQPNAVWKEESERGVANFAEVGGIGSILRCARVHLTSATSSDIQDSEVLTTQAPAHSLALVKIAVSSFCGIIQRHRDQWSLFWTPLVLIEVLQTIEGLSTHLIQRSAVDEGLDSNVLFDILSALIMSMSPVDLHPESPQRWSQVSTNAWLVVAAKVLTKFGSTMSANDITSVSDNIWGEPSDKDVAVDSTLGADDGVLLAIGFTALRHFINGTTCARKGLGVSISLPVGSFLAKLPEFSIDIDMGKWLPAGVVHSTLAKLPIGRALATSLLSISVTEANSRRERPADLPTTSKSDASASRPDAPASLASSSSRRLAMSEELPFRVGDLFDDPSELFSSGRVVVTSEGSFPNSFASPAAVICDLLQVFDSTPEGTQVLADFRRESEVLLPVLALSILTESFSPRVILNMVSSLEASPRAVEVATRILRPGRGCVFTNVATRVRFLAHLLLHVGGGTSSGLVEKALWKDTLEREENATPELSPEVAVLLVFAFHLAPFHSREHLLHYCCSFIGQTVQNMKLRTSSALVISDCRSLFLLRVIFHHICSHFDSPPGSWMTATSALLSQSELSVTELTTLLSACIPQLGAVLELLPQSVSDCENSIRHALWISRELPLPLDSAELKSPTAFSGDSLEKIRVLLRSVVIGFGDFFPEPRSDADRSIDDKALTPDDSSSVTQMHAMCAELAFQVFAPWLTGLEDASEKLDGAQDSVSALLLRVDVAKQSPDGSLTLWEHVLQRLTKDSMESGRHTALLINCMFQLSRYFVPRTKDASADRIQLAEEAMPFFSGALEIASTLDDNFRQLLISSYGDICSLPVDVARVAVASVSAGIPVTTALSGVDEDDIQALTVGFDDLSFADDPKHPLFRLAHVSTALDGGKTRTEMVTRRLQSTMAACLVAWKTVFRLYRVVTRAEKLQVSAWQALVSRRQEIIRICADQVFVSIHPVFQQFWKSEQSRPELVKEELFKARASLVAKTLGTHGSGYSALLSNLAGAISPMHVPRTFVSIIEDALSEHMLELLRSCGGDSASSAVSGAFLEAVISSFRGSNPVSGDLRPLAFTFCQELQQAAKATSDSRVLFRDFFRATLLSSGSPVSIRARARALVESVHLCSTCNPAIAEADAALASIFVEELSMLTLRQGGDSLEQLVQVLFDIFASGTGTHSGTDLHLEITARLTRMFSEVPLLKDQQDVIAMCDGVSVVLSRLSALVDSRSKPSDENGPDSMSVVASHMATQPSSVCDHASASKRKSAQTRDVGRAFEHLSRNHIPPYKQYLMLQEYSDLAGVEAHASPEELIQTAEMGAMERCTYSRTASEYSLQHWYFCYTCDFTAQNGCCSVCAQTCHAGHELAYSRRSRFYCDCGAAKGTTACKSLTRDTLSLLPMSTTKHSSDVKVGTFGFKRRQRSGSPGAPISLELVEGVAILARRLAEALQVVSEQALTSSTGSNASEDLALFAQRPALPRNEFEELARSSMSARPLKSYNPLVEHRGLFTSNAFDSLLKSSGPSMKELRSTISKREVYPELLCAVPSLLSSRSRGRAIVGVAEGEHLRFADLSAMFEPAGPSTFQRSAARRQSVTETLDFSVVGVSANPACDSYVAAWGLREVRVVTVTGSSSADSTENSGSGVDMELPALLSRVGTESELSGPKTIPFPFSPTHQLSVELNLEGSAKVLCCRWVPGSKVALAVVTTRDVKIFDLSDDQFCPTHHFVLPTAVSDACFGMFDGHLRLFVTTRDVSVQHHVFTVPVILEAGPAGALGARGAGTVTLTQALDLSSGRRDSSSGAESVFFSPLQELLFVAYGEEAVAARLNADGSRVDLALHLPAFPANGANNVRGSNESALCGSRWCELSPSYENRNGSGISSGEEASGGDLSVKKEGMVLPVGGDAAQIGWAADITQEDAEALLLSSPVRSFVIRWSFDTSSYVLSFVMPGRRVNHLAPITPVAPDLVRVTAEGDDGSAQEHDNIFAYVRSMQASGIISAPASVSLDAGSVSTDSSGYPSPLESLIVCVSKKANTILVCRIGHGDSTDSVKVQTQVIDCGSKASVRVAGVTTVPSCPEAGPSFALPSLLVFLDDGSLYRYVPMVSSIDRSLLLSRASAETVEFSAMTSRWSDVEQSQLRDTTPVTAFEYLVPISARTAYGGKDLVSQNPPEAVVSKLLSTNEDDYVQSPRSDGLDIEVWNGYGSKLALAGVRVLLGHNAPHAISKRISVFDRVAVETHPGERRWYDIPFTRDEILRGHWKASLHFSECHQEAQQPVVDSIVPYAVSKDQFEFGDQEGDLGTQEFSRPVGRLRELMKPGSAGSQITHALAWASKLLTAVCEFDRSQKNILETCRSATIDIFTRVGSETRHADLSGEFNGALKGLLRAVCVNKVQETKVKDEIASQFVGNMIRQPSDISANGLLLLASALRVQVRKRQIVLVALLAEDSGATLTKLIDRVGSCPGLSHSEQVVLYSVLADVSVVGLIATVARNDAGARAVFLRAIDAFLSKSMNISAEVASSLMRFIMWATRIQDRNTLSKIEDYYCDECSSGPLTGRRWRCQDCEPFRGFDLCETCFRKLPKPDARGKTDSDVVEASHEHLPTHTLRKASGSRRSDDSSLSLLHDSKALSISGVSPADEITLLRAAGELSDSPKFSVPFLFHVDFSQTMGFLCQSMSETLFGISSELRGMELFPAAQVVATAYSVAMRDEKNHSSVILGFSSLCASLKAATHEISSFVEVDESSHHLERVIVLMLLCAAVLDCARKLAVDARVPGQESLSRPEDGDPKAPAKNGLAGRLVEIMISPEVAVFPGFVGKLHSILLKAAESETVEFANTGSSASDLLSKDATNVMSTVGVSTFLKKRGATHSWTPLLPSGFGVAENIFAAFRHVFAFSLLRVLRVFFAAKPPHFSVDEMIALADEERVAQAEGEISGLARATMIQLSQFLCSGPSQSRLRIEVKKTLRSAAGSAEGYRRARNFRVFEDLLAKVRAQESRTQGFRMRMDFETRVELVEHVASIGHLAHANPLVWREFAIRGDVPARRSSGSGILPLLLELVFSIHDTTVERVLALLDWALLVEDSPSSQLTNFSEFQIVADAAISLLRSKTALVSRLVAGLLLASKSESVRARAANVMVGLWRAAAQHKSAAGSLMNLLLTMMMDHLEAAPTHGVRSKCYLETLALMLRDYADHSLVATSNASASAKQGISAIAERLCKVLSSSLHLLSEHINSSLYQTISSYVVMDGYYLETSPCFVCSDSSQSWRSRVPLSMLQAESKFTGNSQLVRLEEPLSIRGFSLKISNRRAGKSLRTLNVYVSTRRVSDITEIRGKGDAWQRVKQVELRPDQVSLNPEFAIPVNATCLLFEYASLHEDLLTLSRERLTCPRCSTVVTTSTCPNCKENVHQCGKCRNINFDDQTSFLCNECGHSRWGQFDYSLDVRPHVGCLDIVSTDAQRDEAVGDLQRFALEADRRWSVLARFREQLVTLTQALDDDSMDDSTSALFGFDPNAREEVSASHISPIIGRLGQMYSGQAKTAFNEMSSSIQQLLATRAELERYLQSQRALSAPSVKLSSSLTDVVESPPQANDDSVQRCFGCSNYFVEAFLNSLVTHLCTPQEAATGGEQAVSDSASVWCSALGHCGLVDDLMRVGLTSGSAITKSGAQRALRVLIRHSADAADRAHAMVEAQLQRALSRGVSEVSGSLSQPLIEIWAEEVVSAARDIQHPGWELRARQLLQTFATIVPRCVLLPPFVEVAIGPLLKALTDFLSLIDGSTSVGKVVKMFVSVDSKTWTRGGLSSTFDTWITSATGESDGKSLPKGRRRDAYLQRKFWDRWVDKARVSRGSVALKQLSWLPVLLFHPTHPDLRERCVQLLRAWSVAGGLVRRFGLLSVAAEQLLPYAVEAQHDSREFLSWFEEMLGTTEQSMVASDRKDAGKDDVSLPLPVAKMFLASRGFLGILCKLIAREVDRVRATESLLAVDLSRGFVLYHLVSFLASMLDAELVLSRAKQSLRSSGPRSDNMLDQLLAAFLALRGVVLQRTKFVKDAQEAMEKILDLLSGGALSGIHSEDDSAAKQNTRLLMTAYVRALDKCVDARTPVFVFEQLNNVVCSPQALPEYFVHMNKCPTQDEFIRGSMTQNPYALSTIIEADSHSETASDGPLMSDVKDRIIRALGLDPDGLLVELLICDKIVSQSLSVRAVFENLWKPSLPPEQREALSAAALLPEACKPPAVSSERQAHPLAPFAMHVKYRLQGLFGEATEEMFDAVPDQQDSDLDPEEEFSVTNVFRQCGGLEKMVSMLQSVGDITAERELSRNLVRLLFFCCKVRANRQHLIVSTDALQVLLSKLTSALDAAEAAHSSLVHFEEPDGVGADINDVAGKGQAERARATIEIAEMLLATIVAVVQEVSRDTLLPGSSGGLQRTSGDLRKSQSMEILLTLQPTATRRDQLMALVQRMESSAMIHENDGLRQALARVLPFLTYGDGDIADALIDSFAPHLLFKEFDALNPGDSVITSVQQGGRLIQSWTDAMQSMSPDDVVLRDRLVAKGIVQILVNYVAEEVDVTDEILLGKQASASLPHVLEQLTNICSQHLASQRVVFDAGVIPKLHALEKVTGVEKIGNLAENCMEALREREDGTDFTGVVDAVDEIRSSEAAAKKERARLHREEMLRKMGLQVKDSSGSSADNGSSRSPAVIVPRVSDSLMQDMLALGDDDEDEDLVCMVCQEGYKYKPDAVMGVYVFSYLRPLSSLSLEDEQDPDVQRDGSRRAALATTDDGVSTVSYFNLIHFQCHADAARAEQQMKPAKEEWEGAAIRNQHTLCNNLLPQLSATISEDAYAGAVEQYWQQVQQLWSQGGYGHRGAVDRLQNPGQRLRLLGHDIKFLLLRFARNQSFSGLSHGGGKESNARLLTQMLAMGLVILSSSGQWPTMSSILDQYLTLGEGEGGSDALVQNEASNHADSAFYHTASALFLQSLSTWQEKRLGLLRRLLLCEYSRGNNLDDKASADLTLFDRVRPAFMYFALADRLQHALKHKLPGVSEISDGVAPQWASHLLDSMRSDMTAVLESVGGDWVREIEEYVDIDSAQEFLDSLELLEEVLGAFGSADAFVESSCFQEDKK